MPRIKATGLPKDEPELTSGGNFYDGPMPPKGTYHGTIKFVKVKENKNGDMMLSVLFIVDETGEKKKYNGYGAFGNINMTEKSAWAARQFAESIGAKYKDFQNMSVDNEEPPNLLKLGTVKIDGDTPVTVTLRPNVYQGNVSMQIGTFLIPANADVDDDDIDDDEDDEDEESPF